MRVHPQPAASRGRGPRRRLGVRLPISRLLLLFAYTALVFGSGALLSAYILDRLDRQGRSLADAVGQLRSALAAVPASIRSAVSRSDAERIALEVGLQDFSKLARKRAEALAAYHLEATEDDYVPATIRHGDEALRAWIRLKGDWIDHLSSDRWSFRVKLRGGSTLFGMRRFSIQHPKTRNYIYEWIYHQALAREGLVALRYDFIDVTLNGTDLGLYALEEHFDEHLVEHSRRPTGPIVRFDEGLMFRVQLQHLPFREHSPRSALGNTADSSIVEPYYAAEIDAFQSSRALSDPALRAQQSRAARLLEAFRRGELSTSEAFDVETLARFFALSDLLGALHSSQWRNMRFYYNPITSRLEPIAFDADAGAPIRHLTCVVNTEDDELAPIGERRGPFIRRIFEDLAFFEQYVRHLTRVAEASYLDALWADLDEDLGRRVALLKSEFPRFRFSERIIARNQLYLRTVLDPPQALQAHHRRTLGGRIELELGNLQALPIEVLGLAAGDSVIATAPPETTLPPAPVLPPRPVEFVPVVFDRPPGEAAPESSAAARLEVRYRLLGSELVRRQPVLPWPYPEEAPATTRLAAGRPDLGSFEFLTVNETAREILVEPGDWRIDRDLVFPAGYRVVAGAGTRLRLSGSAAILSFSPLHFVGAPDSPIVVDSPDGTGQGLVVLQADGESVLDGVVFENLSSLDREGWALTGAVTFYESPVEILRAGFAESRSEDALHIVRSRFRIHRSLFRGALSDAFDSDFSDGWIGDSRFLESGDDAIDLSGSVVELRGIVVDGSGDKALSAGERSQITARDMEIRRAEIGLASKDGSSVTASGLRISDGGVGLAAFRKKAEFGPASIDILGLRIEAVGSPFLVEAGSTVRLEGRQLPATERELKKRLYDGVD